MYGKMKRIIVATLVAIMILSAFPMMANAAEENAPAPGRANEITVNDIEVTTEIPFEEDGVNGNGEYVVAVNFTLPEQMVSVNVTVNVTHNGSFETNATEKLNLSAGDHDVLLQKAFDFTDPGLYTINASIDGWNGTGMIDGALNISDVNFTTIIDFYVNISIEAPDVGGVYGKGPIEIHAVVKNTGNSIIENTNVTIEAVNVSSQIAEVFTEAFEGIEILAPNMESEPVQFFWIPSKEGDNSDYDITITATNVTGGVSNNTTLRVSIKNITVLHIVDMTGFGDTQGGASTFFDVNVQLNNTGNAAGKGTVHLVIYPEGDPGNPVIDLTNTSDDVAPEEGTATREEGTVVFPNLSIDTPGEYMVKASIAGTEEEMIKNLTIEPDPNLAPDLMNVSLSPDPTAVNVLVGEEITFSVVYKDVDGDAGTVKLYIDNIMHDMVNGSATWLDGVTFTYTWAATNASNHSYNFVANDGTENKFMEHVDYNFTVYEHTDGWLYGKVTDGNGNVSNASVVIYITAMNATNVTYIDKYYNTTTDANGDFSKFLPFTDTKYVIMLDETWLADNKLEVTGVNKQNFEIKAATPKAWVNYTLTDAAPPPVPTYLVGKVVDEKTGENLSGVTITVEIFKDVEGNMTALVDGVNVTINTTTRTWMNLTATTDMNGSYAVMGVPHGQVDIDDAKVTGTMVYRHDVAEPEGAILGWWLATAELTDYVTQKKSLEFKEAMNTTWNVTLPKDITVLYSISGAVNPASATVKYGTTAVVVDSTTGNFTVTNLTVGTYVFTFTADGYITRTENATIIDADVLLGTIKLVPDPDSNITYTMKLGPWMENDEDGKPGVEVSFSFLGKDYEGVTGSDGYAVFKEFPVLNLPDDIKVTHKFGDEAAVTEDVDDLDLDKWRGVEKPVETDGNDILLIVAIVVIVFIIIILVVLAMKSKGGEEELYDEEVREYECPSCGAIVTSDMDTCPECGESFEEEEFRCPECSEMVEKDATICDSCGSEFEMPEKVEEEIEEGEEGDELEPPEDDVPEAIDEFDVEDEDAELEGVEDLEEELEEESLDMDDE